MNTVLTAEFIVIGPVDAVTAATGFLYRISGQRE
jgi:hypothetical protein